MTSKELSELLNVSKRTINNKIKKLKIKPKMIGNRYDIAAEDVEKIIKNICKENYSEFLEKAKAFYPITSATEDDLSKNEHYENKNENTENINEHFENYNEQSENKSKKIEQSNEQNEKDITDKLIKMLEKSLEDKENTIRAQQSQIDMLIKSNAMLMQRLEDKQQEKEVIVSEPPKAAANENDRKQSWFKRFFGGSSQEQTIEM